jgi:4-hydroxybenzoate polyprenyltransferase
MEKLRIYSNSLSVTFDSWVISFWGIVLLRMFFEQFSSIKPGEFSLIEMPAIIHAVVFYLATILILMTILMFFGKTNLKEVSTVCLFGFFVICLGPIIDLAVGGVGGHLVSYLFLPMQELWLRFITFFGGHITSGITLGIQVETIFGMIFCYLYVNSATKNKIRAVGAAILFYCFIFLMVSVPSVISFFLPAGDTPVIALVKSIFGSHVIQNNLHPDFTAMNEGLLNLAFDKLMIGINTIFALLASLFLFFLGTRKKFIAIIKNSRPERIFHFLLLFVFGSALASSPFFVNWIDVVSYALAFIAFVAVWMFSVCQNDIYDEEIDRVANPNRPLATRDLSKNDLEIASKIFLILGFASAYAAGHYILFFVSFFLLVYYIFSNPPLRLKRFVGLNSFLVSLACLAIILAGFFLVSPNKNILAFPFSLVLAIVVFFATVSNIRDIKDVEGDRVGGIKTLPVLLGIKKSKKLIAGIICFFFLLIPWYFHLPSLFIPSIVATILSWYFITKEDYKEWPGFVVYMLYLIFLIGAIFLS